MWFLRVDGHGDLQPSGSQSVVSRPGQPQQHHLELVTSVNPWPAWTCWLRDPGDVPPPPPWSNWASRWVWFANRIANSLRATKGWPFAGYLLSVWSPSLRHTSFFPSIHRVFWSLISALMILIRKCRHSHVTCLRTSPSCRPNSEHHL